MIRTATIILMLAALPACTQAIDQPSSASLDGDEHEQMQRSIEQANLSARLTAAESGIAELRREVRALRASLRTRDDQALTRRIDRLQARIDAYGPPPEAPAADAPPHDDVPEGVSIPTPPVAPPAQPRR